MRPSGKFARGIAALAALAGVLAAWAVFGAEPAEPGPDPEKAAPPQEEAPPSVSLFNGRDLEGWTRTGAAEWLVEDGCLVGTQTTGKGGDLVHEKEWEDFELRATYRVHWPANSGFWFRYDKGKGYQFDILKWKNPVAYSGTLYCPGKMFLTKNLHEAIENRDGWNEARIWARGDHLILWLNGKRVGECRDKTHAKGRIGIQVHGGDEFKGMKIVIRALALRPLKADEAPPPMTEAEKPPPEAPPGKPEAPPEKPEAPAAPAPKAE